VSIFPFFSKKKQPVLVRCTYCYDEFYLSPREVRLLETKNAGDPVCPVKKACPHENGGVRYVSYWLCDPGELHQ